MTESLQRQICCYIETYHRRHGYAPKQAEVRAHIGETNEGKFNDLMHQLRDEGVIHFVDRDSRTLTVVRFPNLNRDQQTA